MASLFRVKHGGSVYDNKGRLHVGGSLITNEHCTSQQLEEHLKSGYIEPAESYAAPEAAKIVEEIPGRDQMPPLKEGESVVTRASAAGVESFKVESSDDEPAKVAAATPQPSAGVVIQQESIWNLDPATLKGKDVNQLNAMVKERSLDVTPFETAEEAAAYLSKDYKPAAK